MPKSRASLHTGPNERTCEQQEYFPSTHARRPYFLKIKNLKISSFPENQSPQETVRQVFQNQ